VSVGQQPIDQVAPDEPRPPVTNARTRGSRSRRPPADGQEVLGKRQLHHDVAEHAAGRPEERASRWKSVPQVVL